MTKHIYAALSGRAWRIMVAASGLIALSGFSQCAGAQEALLSISGRGIEAIRLTLSQLAKLPSRRVTVTEQDSGQSDYLCVPVSELLRLAKVPLGRDLRGEWLSRNLAVKAADGYEAVFALPELDPEFTNAAAALCYSKNGRAVPSSEGPLRLVIPGEKRHSRWVRQVVEIRVTN